MKSWVRETVFSADASVNKIRLANVKIIRSVKNELHGVVPDSPTLADSEHDATRIILFRNVFLISCMDDVPVANPRQFRSLLLLNL